MSLEASAVPGLVRSDPHGPGITRVRGEGGVRYLTPAVARSSYIDPRLIVRYESDGHLPGIPRDPVALPASPEAEIAVAALLTTGQQDDSRR